MGNTEPTVAAINEVKARQRRVFVLGFGAASIPLVCQIVAYAVVLLGKPGFPSYDNEVLGLKFWCIQIMLVSVAVAGNTIVDFGKFVVDHSVKKFDLVARFFLICVLFLIQSLLFSSTFLNKDLPNIIALPITVFGLANLFIAYGVDMEIALAEVGRPT